MKRYTFIVGFSVAVCLLACLSAFNSQANTKRGQEDKLDAAVREAHSKWEATRQDSTPYVSLTVATKRLSQSSATLALAVDSDDTKLLAEIPELRLSLRPVIILDAKTGQVQELGTPNDMTIPKSRGVVTGSTLRTGNFLLNAPEQANGIAVKMNFDGVAINYFLGLSAGINTGIVAFHKPSYAAKNSSLLRLTKIGYISSATNTPTSIVQACPNCVTVNTTCGTCRCNITCNTCGGSVNVFCDPTTNPPSCGVICGAGCSGGTGCQQA